MKEGIGTTFNLTLLFFFILIVSGFALFATNYYRAFNVKNNLITLTEKYEANFGNGKFKDKRSSLVNEMSYKIDNSQIKKVRGKGWNCPSEEGWCYKVNTQDKKFAFERKNKNYYKCTYTIKTFVSTDIPAVNKIFLNTPFFEVDGKTKPIVRMGGC